MADTLDDSPDIEKDALADAVSRLSSTDLWRPEKLAAVYLLSPHRWEVRSVLDRHREALIQKEVLKWLSTEPGLENTWRGNEDLGDFRYSIPALLDEYDSLTIFSTSTLKQLRWKETLTQSDLAVLKRVAELRGKLTELEVNWSLREELLTLLTDFRMAAKLTSMDATPVSSTRCEMLEATARYLATPELQNSWITRFFILSFVGRVRKELLPRVHTSKRIRNRWPLVLFVLAILGALNRAMNLVSDTSLVMFICIGAFLAAGWIRSAYLGAKADAILSDIEERVGYLNAPLTEDGRELSRGLRKLEKLQVQVPTLLFSLLHIALPGR